MKEKIEVGRESRQEKKEDRESLEKVPLGGNIELGICGLTSLKRQTIGG